MALPQPCFFKISCYGSETRYSSRRSHRSWTMSLNSSSPETREEKESPKEVVHHNHKLSIPQFEDTISSSELKFNRLQPHDLVSLNHEKKLEFGKFVAREALIDEEYWVAAWLRAESHWEDRANDRYVDKYKRKFADQEYNALKRRCRAQIGHKCTCIVAVKKEDKDVKRTVIKSVVGTLDLSIQYFPTGASVPGEQIKAPLFRSLGQKTSETFGYISNLCVIKSSRRQGIASNMLLFSISSAQLNGAEQVLVHVHRDNKAAQELYYKIGFQIVEEADVNRSDEATTYLLRLGSESK